MILQESSTPGNMEAPPCNKADAYDRLRGDASRAVYILSGCASDEGSKLVV